ncbi:MAG: DUF3105 domain-containing protein [Chloroflexota bacterium]|nr:DUF3105 domain-containing protein [Chloroflexota bacterium]
MSSRTAKQSQNRQNKGGQHPQPQKQTRPQVQNNPMPSGTGVGIPAGASAAAVEAKREARMGKQAQARAVAQRRRRMKNLRLGAILGALVLLVVGGIVYLMVREASKPGQLIAQIPSPHVQLGEAHAAYNSDPPTSGPHLGQVPEWKVYTVPITKELQVHGLEDGGVIFNYQPNLDKAVVANLQRVAERYLAGPSDKSHIVMSPYPGLAHPIVLTTWQRMDNLDTFDEAEIRRFTDEYVGIDHHEGSPGRQFP